MQNEPKEFLCTDGRKVAFRPSAIIGIKQIDDTSCYIETKFGTRTSTHKVTVPYAELSTWFNQK